jgi:hypothetical protein
MEELVEEIRRLGDQVRQLQAARRMDEDVPGGQDEEDLMEDGEENQVCWGELLQGDAVTANRPEARELCSVMASPPPFDKLKSLVKTIPKYTLIPNTPPPRPKHRLDSSLTTPQQKMEHAMHTLVDFVETNEKQSLLHTAAMIRSAWEDLHQQRRQTLAGRQSFKLDKRSDDNRARLLTQEEESKIVRPRPQPRPTRFWGDTSSSSKEQQFSQKSFHDKPRTPSRGKGRGKGKGGKSL